MKQFTSTGRIQLAEMEDPNRGRIIKAFYMDSDELVLLNDGVDTWMAPVHYSCFKMKLADRIKDFKSGKRLDGIPMRRRVDEPRQRVVLKVRRHVD